MKITICFLVFASYSVGLPVDESLQDTKEFDLSKFKPNNIYIHPINSINSTAGFPESRVIGGTEVSPNSIPYQAALRINGNSLCGGSLISTTSVLTAAHCTISASYVEVRLGAHNFTQNETTQIRVTSTNIINHSQYDSATLSDDISVVLLPSSVVLKDNIQIVPLATLSSGTFEGATGFLTGWGRISEDSNSPSPVLLGVNLDIISVSDCRNVYGSLINAYILCTSGSGNVGGCTGDSGSPLVVDGILAGVVSFSPARCASGFPTGFSRISIYRSWIEENAGV